jgi:F420H(2)-dependent quinone reductase
VVGYATVRNAQLVSKMHPCRGIRRGFFECDEVGVRGLHNTPEAERQHCELAYLCVMSTDNDYEPSPWDWVRNQVETYESSGGREGTTLLDTGLPVIIVTMRGSQTGKIRKAPVMRVEHDGEFALVASKGGDPKNPGWYTNLITNPHEVCIQDGPDVFDVDVRELYGSEREVWWERAVAAYPPYAEYQRNTERLIPIFVATRR